MTAAALPSPEVEADGFITVYPPLADTQKTRDLVELAKGIHVDNAKWWHDLDTGACILETRNRGDLLMLAVTELAEADDGIYGEMDDKLPDLPMYDCELADTAIRTLDLLGAELKLGRLSHANATTLLHSDPEINHCPTLRTLSMGEQLWCVAKLLCRAKEAERKSRWEEFHCHLVDVFHMLCAIADIHRVDLLCVIEQKRAFNRVRPDHQPENRRAADGKKS